MKAEEERLGGEETFDVVVVGSGFAGLAAAIEAGSSGASVLVVEKNRSTGGNSRISDGGIAAPCTDIQEKYGIEDSKELFFDDIMRSGLERNHTRLVEVLVEQAEKAFLWSRDVLGVPYLDRIDIFGGHSVPRCYTAEKVTGGTIINTMLSRLREAGIVVRTGTSFIRLLQDGEGRSIGAELLSAESGKRYTVAARGGVVLAAGGYGADVAFRSIQDPRLDASVDTTNRPTATAEVLKGILKLGGQPVQLESIQLGPWASPDEKGFGHGPMFSEYIVFQYGLIVDPQTGRRFVNELTDRKRLSDALFACGHPCIGIADAAAVESSGWDISPALRTGVVRQFESLEQLAAGYGIPAEELQESVGRYNRYVGDGVDREFGKQILSDAVSITKPPFQAIRLWPKVHHVSGGIGIDEQARVLDTDGIPIRGVYAAGEIAGGIHGANRLGSCAITECLVFGRIAGRNCAAELP